MLNKTMTPGMDENQAQQDRGGFRTKIEYLTGGVSYNWDDGGGPEVGNPYDGDPMGENYQAVTYAKGGGGKY